MITEFYLMFESIVKYVTDLNRFVEDLDSGFYIQMTIETVLQNLEGKQLLVRNYFYLSRLD